jgi:hypothetical protein
MKRMLCLYLFIFASQSNAQVSDFNEINFHKADSIALEFKNLGLNSLPELSYKLTSNLETDVERFRSIYLWVCSNIANDYSQYSKNMGKRKRFKNDSLKLKVWNEHFRKISFKKLLRDHKTICTGYAYLIQELSNLAGINCVIIHGFARTSSINVKTLDVPNHSWNAVELNGKWYLCDPTWASGVPNPTTNEFEFQYNDGFFLSHPKLFATNHFPLDTKWLLLDGHEPTFENFLDAPITYGKAYTHMSIYNEPKKMHNIIQKDEKVIFKFQLLKPAKVEDISLMIDNGSETKKIHPELITINNQFLIIEYEFKTTGFYDVHLLIGPDLISTYTFKVKS